jgi:hypothetical protein
MNNTTNQINPNQNEVFVIDIIEESATEDLACNHLGCS